MTDELHGQIKQLIEVNGPMGVNAIQREIGIPLSTLQKYLDYKQTYFVKTDKRQWDLPESMAAKFQLSAADNFASTIETQIQSIRALMDAAMAQLNATLTLMSAQKSMSAPVAVTVNTIKTNQVSNQPITKTRVAAEISKIIRTNKTNMTDSVYEFLMSINWKLLEDDMGSEYIRDNIYDELAEMIQGKREYFSDEVRDPLDAYIKS